MIRNRSIGSLYSKLHMNRPAWTRTLSSLVPNNRAHDTSFPQEAESHFRWIEQKYAMGQDQLLLGLPTSYRRRMVMALAQMRGWEVEYLAITKDTTESDLKQRREIIGDSAVYSDQAPVRAAIHGRVLVLDGIENAERNVLPTLNNLLENREMALDDGRFLMRRPTDSAFADASLGRNIVFVSDNFRVIALGLPVPPYSGRALDPPLRSRFQCRFVDEPTSEMLVAATDTSGIDRQKIQSLVTFYETLRNVREAAVGDDVSLTGLTVFSQNGFAQAIKLLENFPAMTPLEAVERFVPTVTWMHKSLPERFQHPLKQAVESLGGGRNHRSYEIAETRTEQGKAELTFCSIGGGVMDTLRSNPVTVQAAAGDENVSHTYSDTAAAEESLNSASVKLLPTQKQILSDLLLDHSIGQHICLLGPKGSGKSVIAREFGRALGYNSIRVFPLYQELTSRDLLQRRITDSDGNTSWADSPLVRAAREGGLCILDGVHTLDVHALCSLRRLLQDSAVDLPNGERLDLLSADEALKGVSGVHPSFRVVALGLFPPKKGEGSHGVNDSRQRYITSDLGFSYHYLPKGSKDDILAVLAASDTAANTEGAHTRHSKIMRLLTDALAALNEIAGDAHPELQPSFRHALNIRTALGTHAYDETASVESILRHALENAFLIRYMPGIVSEQFEVAMEKVGLARSTNSNDDVTFELNDNELSIGNITVPRSNPVNIEKVPRPLFFDNMAQRRILQGMLRTHVSTDHNATLLIGNQGVGKNKLVDHMLGLLRREREYIQLHRDTTVQSLTVLPLLQDGRIVYEDSPLLRAAKFGRVLVVDEADKAPVEVLGLLKMLAEDGELVLYDGRRLLSQDRIKSEFPSLEGDNTALPSDIIPIHKDFRLIVLANRPGYPFHGNNLFRECGDVFSIHVVENLDLKSEIELLRAYGPDVPIDIISRIAHAFQELRKAHESQEMSYPYSAREAVAVVKHVQKYPEDGVAAAVEDILSFEAYNPRVRKQIALIFQSKGIPVPIQPKNGGHGGDLTRKEYVESNILLAPVRPIPAPMTYNASLNSESQVIPCGVYSRHVKQKPWSYNVHKVSDFNVESSRLLSFSEEVGRIYVGDRRKTFHRNMVAGMVTDEANSSVLHVLTRYPLQLYSFYPSDASADYKTGGGGKCVTRSLIDPEIHWRLGDPEAVLSPLPGGGAVVYLPEAHMGLIAPGTSWTDIKPVVHCALPALKNEVSNAANKSGGLFGVDGESVLRNFYSFIDKSVPTSEDNSHAPSLSAIFKQGKNTFHLLDHVGKKSHSVVMPNMSVQSVNRLNMPDSDQSLSHWIVTGNIGDKGAHRFGQCVVSVSAADSHAVSHSFEYTVPPNSPYANDKPMRYVSGWQERGAQWKTELNNSVHASPSDAVGDAHLSGSSTVHCGVLSFPLDAPSRPNVSSGMLTVWPRTESVSSSSAQNSGKLRIVPSANVTGDNMINVVERSKYGSKKNTQYESILEVIDTRSGVAKDIDITNPAKVSSEEFDDMKAGKVVAVSTIKSPDYSLAAVLDSQGLIRLFETDNTSLEISKRSWKRIMGVVERESVDGNVQGLRGEEGTSKPRFGVDTPKHGKEDKNNDPHVGGNTWAGGTGGSDTAGLGGRGGPYRLDKGHKVHQVSEEDKKISAEAKARAAKMAKEAFEQRMRDINMGKTEFESYERFRNAVQQQANQLRLIFEEMTTRSQERVWLRNQNHGELDDTKLIDGLTGDRLVYKRRGLADNADDSAEGTGATVMKKLQFVMDCSGSMYRFNGQDRRLERMLEAALLVMMAMPSGERISAETSNLEYSITGHSGDSENISFVPFGSYSAVKDEKSRLKLLQKMVAHTQFCMSGDNTLEAASYAVKSIVNSDTSGGEDKQYQRYVFVLSDANFERYGISASDIRRTMLKDPRVQVHFILIASLGDEAERFATALPAGRVHMCYESTDLPSIFKRILTSYGGALDTN